MQQQRGTSRGKAGNAVMWTDKAFNIYTGQHDTMLDAAFEPARRREVQLGNLADTQCARSTAVEERTHGRSGHGSFAMDVMSANRRPARG